MITASRPKWRGFMTDRQRFNCQMHYQPIDRCFNMEFGYWKENFDSWDIFKVNGIKSNAEADLFFNFDKIAVVHGKTWMHPVFEIKVIRWNSDKHVIINKDGLLAEVPNDSHETIPHFLESSIKNPNDWRNIKSQRFDPAHPDRVVDIESILNEHPNDRDYPLGVDCGSMIGRIRDLLTFEGLAYAVYDYPEMVEDMVETSCVLVERFLNQVLDKIDFDFASGWEDICFKSGPIVSVDFFKNVVMPRYKRISDKLKKAGIDIWYTDCDGDIRPILPFFLEGGINCMFPFLC